MLGQSSFLPKWITASYMFCIPFPTAEFLLQNGSCKGKKKYVRRWRTNDEEDMALPIIQEKEKGFTKKTTPKNHQKQEEILGDNWEGE